VPATLPDINAETYPYDVVQYLLDQTATFTFYASPVAGFQEAATLTPDHPEDFFGINGGYGLNLCCELRCFDAVVRVGGGDGPLVSDQEAGRRIGTFSAIAMFAPFDDDDLHWTRGMPPPAIYDRWRSQRFVLLDPQIAVEGVGRMCGFGVGRTHPIVSAGEPRLLAGAVANFDSGSGPFAGNVASVALCGTLTRDLGFDGVITMRIPDPAGTFRSESEEDRFDASGEQPGDTFIMMRGEKKDRSVRTVFGPKPGPNLDSLVTPSQMRAVQYGCHACGERLTSGMTAGPVIARMNADVHFNLGAPPGTSDRPGPFTTAEVYEFVDMAGSVVGTISAGVDLGISFGLQFPAAPGQPGVRFTGVGPISGGTGPFADAQGLLTVNSVIGIAPHVLSLTHVLHVVDPLGRFRT
jgi:hypothetical protein